MAIIKLKNNNNRIGWFGLVWFAFSVLTHLSVRFVQ